MPVKVPWREVSFHYFHTSLAREENLPGEIALQTGGIIHRPDFLVKFPAHPVRTSRIDRVHSWYESDGMSYRE
jgi:hypothetical protein